MSQYPSAPPFEPLDDVDMEVDYRRDPLNDPFSLSVSQVFHGPHELKLIDDEHSIVSFSYSDDISEGIVDFYVQDVDGNSKRMTLLNCLLDSITVVPPTKGTNFTGALVLRVDPDCSKRISRHLKTASFLKEKYGRTCIDLENSLEHLVFVLKPWSQINTHWYIRQSPDGKPNSKIWKTWDHLSEKMTWVAMIRWDDLQRPKRVQRSRRYNSKFYEEVTFEAWYQLMAKIGLQMDASSDRCRTIVYSHFTAFKDPKKHLSSALPMRPTIWSNVQVQLLKDLGYGGNGYHVDSSTTVYRTTRMPTPSEPYDPAFYAVPVPEEKVVRMQPPVKKTKKAATTEFISLDEGDAEASTSNDSTSHPVPQAAAEENLAGTTLAIFPPGRMAVTVVFSDMERIAPGEMLNDSIIEVYLRYLIAHEYRVKFRAAERVYTFNTFLFMKLTEKPMKSFLKGESARVIEKRKKWISGNFEKIKKWTRTVDIFSQDLLIFPIHYEQHWYGVFIRHPSKALRPKGEEGRAFEPTDDFAQVFIMDSFYEAGCCLIRENVGFIIREYLDLVFQTKPGEHAGKFFSWEHARDVHVVDLPQQNNLVDCGCFLLTFAENFIAKDPTVENFSTNFRDWCPAFDNKIAFMRVKIRSVLRNLAGHEKWKQFLRYEAQTAPVEEDPDDAVVREARRPRRHSFTTLPRPYPIETKGRRRCRSEMGSEEAGIQMFLPK